MTRNGKMVIRAAILAGLSPLLWACATKFEAADATRIRTIAIAKIEEPKYYSYSYFVMRQDPLIPQGSDFNAVMEKQNLHLGAELAAGVSQALQKDGYAVSDGGDADAVMVLTIAGTLPGQPGPTYSAHGAALEPEFTIKAKLTDARKSKKTLFEQLYLYGNNSIKPMDGSILFVPDQKYYFTSDKQMFEKPETAAAGFRSVVPLISGHIAAAFKKQ